MRELPKHSNGCCCFGCCLRRLPLRPARRPAFRKQDLNRRRAKSGRTPTKFRNQNRKTHGPLETNHLKLLKNPMINYHLWTTTRPHQKPPAKPVSDQRRRTRTPSPRVRTCRWASTAGAQNDPEWGGLGGRFSRKTWGGSVGRGGVCCLL